MRVDFNGIESADGLTVNESAMLSELIAVFNARLASNLKKSKYYADDAPLVNIGLTIPPDIASKVDTHCGFAAKAVDYIAIRSKIDGITSENADVAKQVNALLDANDFAVSYQMALPTEMVHGCGFWAISKGGAGEPPAVITYHNAESAAATWDFRKKRIKAGFCIGDWELESTRNGGEYQPSLVILHTEYAAIEIEKHGKGKWVAIRKPHLIGKPLMVPMCNMPTDTKPFGKSSVTKTLCGIVDEVQRLKLRLSIHSEVFSSGQKAILGVSDEQFDSLQGQKFRAAMSEMLIMTRDENGEIPEISAFAQQSPEPIIKAIELQMSLAAAETGVPVAEFGLSSNGYTSSDALRASTDQAVLICENLNANNGKAIAEVARIALAIATGRTLAELTDDERTIAVHWIDPSMPSAASVADATVKLAGAVPEFGGTDIFWEMNGFNEEQRRRVKADMRSNTTRAALNSLFKGSQTAQEVN